MRRRHPCALLSTKTKTKEPSAAGPQPNVGISRAKTPRPQRSENNGELVLQDNSPLPSELGALCATSINSGQAWRESIPLFEYVCSTDNLRRLRTLSRMTIRGELKGAKK
jgi:hypothetical protein